CARHHLEWLSFDYW
nr:immunoglobulin heavy chain junction region [Macaca mulatta]MOX67239.1 immunoglobulin heavy chain junction region [Macaca mulatta]MOX68052.1 immunoglobulin heavy chain junction region [Macaca mulatta]